MFIPRSASAKTVGAPMDLTDSVGSKRVVRSDPWLGGQKGSPDAPDPGLHRSGQLQGSVGQAQGGAQLGQLPGCSMRARNYMSRA